MSRRVNRNLTILCALALVEVSVPGTAFPFATELTQVINAQHLAAQNGQLQTLNLKADGTNLKLQHNNEVQDQLLEVQKQSLSDALKPMKENSDENTKKAASDVFDTTKDLKFEFKYNNELKMKTGLTSELLKNYINEKTTPYINKSEKNADEFETSKEQFTEAKKLNIENLLKYATGAEATLTQQSVFAADLQKALQQAKGRNEILAHNARANLRNSEEARKLREVNERQAESMALQQAEKQKKLEEATQHNKDFFNGKEPDAYKTAVSLEPRW